jgi:hypothetical protein
MHAQLMDALFDLARFRQDDPDELVMASLACPLCLRSTEVAWKFRSGGYDPSVECSCPRCEEDWRVFMTPQQSLRFGLMGISSP